LAATVILPSSCAKSALPLGGGEKDRIPPGIRTEESTANEQTQWDGSPIVIEFNEWVTLKDKKQIIISPPLEYKPDIELRGKTVRVTLNEEEVLRENTTYVFNFGKAFVDFTEGNPTDNLAYIMSTGDQIDSLTLQGTVRDAYTGEPVPNVTIQAYDLLTDSVLLLERPYYATQTDEGGRWQLTNLKPDTFQIFALEDQNLNYLYDGDPERVGLLDTMVLVKEDSLIQSYDLQLFGMTSATVVDVTHRNSKYLKLKLSNSDENLMVATDTDTISHFTQVGDSLFVWFDSELDSNSVITFTADDSLTVDTLSWRRPKQIIDSLMYITNLSTQPSQTYPGDTVTYVFSHPLSTLDTEQITLTSQSTLTQDDTTQAAITVTDTLNTNTMIRGRDLLVQFNPKAGNQYFLTLNPGLVTDIYGQTNDTIQTIFIAKSKEDFSKIIVTFDSSDTKADYLLELYNNKSIKVREIPLKGGDVHEIVGLLPGEYTAKVIKDDNLNGKWDTGNLMERKQAEEIKSLTLDKLRENWDIELLINWDQL